MRKKNTHRKAAAKATAKPAARAATEPTPARKRWKVWEPGWETGARTVEGSEPTEAALNYCAEAYPNPPGNRCASVTGVYAGERVRRVFMTNGKPVHYLFVEAL